MEIYLIENLINHKKYVGMTSLSIEHRFKQHKEMAASEYPCNTGRSKSILHKAMMKHGVDSFSIHSLEVCEDYSTLKEAEVKWISAQNSHYIDGYGYNMTLGGEGALGYKTTDETKEKLRVFRIGRKHTDESKQKMSASRKGIKHGKEHCKNLGKAQIGEKNHRYGKKLTEEQRKLRSVVLSGENNPFYGKSHTEETKKILSEKNKGRFSGEKNPAARKCFIDGRMYYTCRALMQNENIKLSKFYTLVKNGTIEYASN